MPEQNKSSSTDFAGFVDGFQARNLALIERETSLQYSEMQARLAVLQGQVQGENEIENAFSAIDRLLRDSTKTIIDRLTSMGEALRQILTTHSAWLQNNILVLTQLKGLMRSYLDAAEVSRNQRLIDSALALADTYREYTLNNP